jgi:hypothetical protein
MIQLKTDFKLDLNFRKLSAAIDRKNKAVMLSTGARVRQHLLKSFRTGSRKSSPGEYPRAWAGSGGGLRRVKFAATDRTVIIGPLKMATPKRPRKKSGRRHITLPVGKTFPQLLNEGGSAWHVYYDRTGKAFSRHGTHVRVHYRPRPFVKLAMPTAIAILRQRMKDIPLK